MSRNFGVQLGVLVLLAALATSAVAATATAKFYWSAAGSPGKNHTVNVRYYFFGDGVKRARMYVLRFTDRVNQGNTVVDVPSKYLHFNAATSSKKAVGTNFWQRNNLPHNPSLSSSVVIAVKVQPNIPLHTMHCLYIRAVADTPATATQPAFHEAQTDPHGYCASGQVWLTPVVH